jgi:hypothetical protein
MDMTAIWLFCLMPFTLLSLPFIYESLLPSQVPEPGFRELGPVQVRPLSFAIFSNSDVLGHIASLLV